MSVSLSTTDQLTATAGAGSNACTPFATSIDHITTVGLSPGGSEALIEYRAVRKRCVEQHAQLAKVHAQCEVVRGQLQLYREEAKHQQDLDAMDARISNFRSELRWLWQENYEAAQRRQQSILYEEHQKQFAVPSSAAELHHQGEEAGVATAASSLLGQVGATIHSQLTGATDSQIHAAGSTTTSSIPSGGDGRSLLVVPASAAALAGGAVGGGIKAMAAASLKQLQEQSSATVAAAGADPEVVGSTVTKGLMAASTSGYVPAPVTAVATAAALSQGVITPTTAANVAVRTAVAKTGGTAGVAALDALGHPAVQETIAAVAGNAAVQAQAGLAQQKVLGALSGMGNVVGAKIGEAATGTGAPAATEEKQAEVSSSADDAIFSGISQAKASMAKAKKAVISKSSQKAAAGEEKTPESDSSLLHVPTPPSGLTEAGGRLKETLAAAGAATPSLSGGVASMVGQPAAAEGGPLSAHTGMIAGVLKSKLASAQERVGGTAPPTTTAGHDEEIPKQEGPSPVLAATAVGTAALGTVSSHAQALPLKVPVVPAATTHEHTAAAAETLKGSFGAAVDNLQGQSTAVGAAAAVAASGPAAALLGVRAHLRQPSAPAVVESSQGAVESGSPPSPPSTVVPPASSTGSGVPLPQFPVDALATKISFGAIPTVESSELLDEIQEVESLPTPPLHPVDMGGGAGGLPRRTPSPPPIDELEALIQEEEEEEERQRQILLDKLLSSSPSTTPTSTALPASVVAKQQPEQQAPVGTAKNQVIAGRPAPVKEMGNQNPMSLLSVDNLKTSKKREEMRSVSPRSPTSPTRVNHSTAGNRASSPAGSVGDVVDGLLAMSQDNGSHHGGGPHSGPGSRLQSPRRSPVVQPLLTAAESFLLEPQRPTSPRSPHHGSPLGTDDGERSPPGSPRALRRQSSIASPTLGAAMYVASFVGALRSRAVTASPRPAGSLSPMHSFRLGSRGSTATHTTHGHHEEAAEEDYASDVVAVRSHRSSGGNSRSESTQHGTGAATPQLVPSIPGVEVGSQPGSGDNETVASSRNGHTTTGSNGTPPSVKAQPQQHSPRAASSAAASLFAPDAPLPELPVEPMTLEEAKKHADEYDVLLELRREPSFFRAWKQRHAMIIDYRLLLYRDSAKKHDNPVELWNLMLVQDSVPPKAMYGQDHVIVLKHTNYAAPITFACVSKEEQTKWLEAIKAARRFGHKAQNRLHSEAQVKHLKFAKALEGTGLSGSGTHRSGGGGGGGGAPTLSSSGYYSASDTGSAAGRSATPSSTPRQRLGSLGPVSTGSGSGSGNGGGGTSPQATPSGNSNRSGGGGGGGIPEPPSHLSTKDQQQLFYKDLLYQWYSYYEPHRIDKFEVLYGVVKTREREVLAMQAKKVGPLPPPWSERVRRYCHRHCPHREYEVLASLEKCTSTLIGRIDPSPVIYREIMRPLLDRYGSMELTQ